MRKINMRLGVAALLTCLLASSGTAVADTGSGTISVYQLNGAILDRGACVQMVPALPGTWACVWKSNELYNKLSDLLLSAFLSQKSCTIGWSKSDPEGYHLIDWAECR